MWPSRAHVDYVNPHPDTLNIRDIAHHLSMEVRWCGAMPAFYSVAQHSLMVSRLCFEGWGKNASRRASAWKFAAQGLLHEAGEAFCKDLPTPLKYLPGMEFYRQTEERMRDACLRKFLNICTLDPGVKEFDLAATGLESLWIKGIVQLEAWQPERAEEEFMTRWKYLQAMGVIL